MAGTKKSRLCAGTILFGTRVNGFDWILDITGPLCQLFSDVGYRKITVHFGGPHGNFG
jgi:hypothetical protein